MQVLEHSRFPSASSQQLLSSIESGRQPAPAFESSILIRDGFNWLKSIPENQLNPVVFHGTSRLLLDSILVHGLDPRKNPLNSEDFVFVRELTRRINPQMVNTDLSHISRAADIAKEESIGAVYRQNSISVTLGLASAAGYAEKGPEKAAWFLMSVADLLNSPELVLSSDERVRLNQLHKKYTDLLAAHEPVILALQPRGVLCPLRNGNPFSSVMHDPDLYARLVRIASGELKTAPGLRELNTDDEGLVSVNLEAVVGNVFKRHPQSSPADIMQMALRSNSEFEVKIVGTEDIAGIYAPPRERS